MTMKTLCRGIFALMIAAAVAGCDAFHTLNKKKTAQGRPYELIVVCPQMEWNGDLGDSLRAVFTAPVPYLNQVEPLFDVLRVTERGFKDMIADHRNILKIVVDPEVRQAEAAVEYNVTSEPQIVVTLQGPDDKAVVGYLSQNRDNLLHVLEQAERDRDVQTYTSFNNPGIEAAIRELFGMEISDGSYMITSDAFKPGYQLFRLEGRLWCELRGFWDVEGDFMGGPFVSYTTVDTETNRIFTLDGYVYAPDLNKPRKRNYIRGIEHLLYTIHFPEQQK